ncbi:MAG: peptidase [Bryobacterales bacterium]|nr:peptidase [Bryobacterales bacterium]
MRVLRPLCLLALLPVCWAQQNHGYYRFPALHGDTVVFTSEGDLWKVPVQGGVAQRLTSNPGDETRAAFSPDGKTLAFTAAYEGPTEVYSMSVEGGMPARRTFDGGAAVVGWTPDNKILYSTYRYSTLPDGQLVTIAPDGRIERVPLSQASQGCYDPSGRTLFFTRLPFQGSYAKRYKGGTAQNLWKFSGSQAVVPLTADYAGTSKDPMWWKARVYFLSDRDGTMNLWSMDENGKSLRQHTKHEGWDMKSPSLSDGRVAYQMGADMMLYDIASGADKKIAIDLPSDFDNLREHWIKNPAEYLTSVHLAPDGGSVVLTARGRAFVAPVKQGRFVDASAYKPGRFRDVRMMPDGKSLLALSSESGEVEVWKVPANGVGAGEQLTKDGQVLRWEAVASPDGKWVAHQNKNNELWLLDIATKAQKRIGVAEDSASGGPGFDYVRWSPDSRWLVYSRDAANGFSQLMLFSVDTAMATPLTTDRYNSLAATWSADGKFLYFLSDRALHTTVRAPWGSRQPDPFFDRSMKLYELPLKVGAVSPFEPMNELRPKSPETPAKPDEKAAAPPKVEIDLDRIAARIQEVPLPPGNYTELTATASNRLCWVNRDHGNPEKNALECVDISNKGDKPEVLIEGVRDFEVSGDGKKMLVRKQEDIYVLDTAVRAATMSAPKTLADAKVDLGTWTFSVIPTQEFKESFLDAWRLHRDYFYDRKMHGVTWTAMRNKYGEIIGRVRDRQELNDLISDMVSELSVLHTFVRGGDIRRGPDQIQLASLGARFMREPGGNGYVVDHIYATDPDRPDKMSPLARPGVDVHEGDVIVSINGREGDPGEALRNQTHKQVLLRVRTKGSTETRDVIAKAISLEWEQELRYTDWEFARRQMVEKAAPGQIGYIHLRAMGPTDMDRWIEEYTPVFDRQGLIIDVRHNRGGNIDSWILDRLSRKAWMYWQSRTGKPTWNMQEAFRGHMVVLCDQWTASDGEAFTEGFRRLGLGKSIGMRTWGGEVWLSASNFQADRGIATAAESGVYGPEGKWLIEGYGVDPDITVDNSPHATFEGKDAQLEAAVAYLQKLIREKPVTVPGPPEYPDKSFPVTKGGGGEKVMGAIRE